MSGNQSALLGAGGGRWITNPKHLPLHVMQSATILVKTGTSGTAAANNSAIYTSLANRGAQASISVADTYVTIANLSGAGFLFNVISPTHSASFAPTIRITVDGTVYTFAPSSSISSGYRLLLGPLIPMQPATAAGNTASTVGDIPLPLSGNDPGFASGYGSVGGVPNIGGNSGLLTPEQILSMGWSCLRFEQSLLVEAKCSLLSGTAVDKSCAATYRLDL